ncbi:MAG: hypothetical protein OEU26_28935 [Candidatus Tectomicrobia bacterium]|nr:hypothetical protein [Candidatus Tectomicrobia bacterium]
MTLRSQFVLDPVWDEPMDTLRKILLTLEVVVVVPVTVYLSMLVATWGAEAVGQRGGDWGWGFMLAVPGGMVLGLILSVIGIVVLIAREEINYVSVALLMLPVCAAVFVISAVVHWLILLLI